MSEPRPDGKSGVKTLGIKLPPGLHAQFALVAQLGDLSLTDAMKRAVELYVETKQAEGTFKQRAAARLEEIEREPPERREAGNAGTCAPHHQQTRPAAKTPTHTQ